jgi:hypothetical protein
MIGRKWARRSRKRCSSAGLSSGSLSCCERHNKPRWDGPAGALSFEPLDHTLGWLKEKVLIGPLSQAPGVGASRGTFHWAVSVTRYSPVQPPPVSSTNA